MCKQSTLVLHTYRITLFSLLRYLHCVLFFFFNDTATTEIYTLSLHDALPILFSSLPAPSMRVVSSLPTSMRLARPRSLIDRKSTRLNSSHSQISYAVFCLKKKKKAKKQNTLIFYNYYYHLKPSILKPIVQNKL